MGCRRLLALVRGLPRDAAAWREDPEAQWTQEHELLATVAELQDFWGRRVAMSLWSMTAKKGTKPPKFHEPVQVKHPARELLRAAAKPKRKRKKVSLADVVQRIGR